MKNGKTFLLMVFLFSAFMVKAQKGETYLNLNYNVALPMGNFKNVISSTSYRGFEASILHGITDNLSIGLGTGYQDFYKKNPRQLYKLSDGSDLSAVVSYSIQTTPILAELKYNFTPAASIQPYAAIGVGGNVIEYNKLYGEFGDRQGKIRFAARPEAGLSISLKQGGSGFTIGASYNIMPFHQDEFSNLNNLGINAGIRIPLQK